MFLRFLLISLTNIFFPFVRRVGVLFFTSRGSGTKRRAGGQRRNAAQRRVAGRESRRGECQNAVGSYFGAKAALDFVTVRAVAERRPPERSGVDERRAAFRFRMRDRC